MDLKDEIEPVLKKHSLVAFLINDGWLLIRRKEYIDLYIPTQPFNSVEVMFQIEAKVMFMSFTAINMIFKTTSDLHYFRSFMSEYGEEPL